MWGGEFANIKATLINGRNAQMPGWDQVLSAQQISDLVQFVKTLSAGTVAATQEHPGKTTYDTYCIACHGANGKGNAMLGSPDLTNDIWQYGGDDAALTETIVKGRGGQMPAFGALLGEQKVHLLAAYIYSLNTSASQPSMP